MTRLAQTFFALFAASFLYAQEVLTNETILKLAKAGLSDDVIAGMVNNQPGKYSLDSDGVIALKLAPLNRPCADSVVTAKKQPVSINNPFLEQLFTRSEPTLRSTRNPDGLFRGDLPC